MTDGALQRPTSPPDVGRRQPTRPEIAMSWRRSQLSGVPAEVLPDVPVEEDLTDPESRFAHAARPVLDRLCEEIAGSSMSVMVTDAAAHIVERRAGSLQLCDDLDQVVAVPGARYAEDVVGTNGLGTAAETRRPVVISGADHFSERLRCFTCVASPVLDPVTGRLQGVVDITSASGEASPLMVPVVAEAAREIQRRLGDMVSAAERALFEQFMVALHRSRAPLVSLNESFVIANDAALALLSADDHALLWERSVAALSSASSTMTVLLGDNRTYRAEVRHVTDGGVLVGALLRLYATADAVRADDEALPGLVGASAPWHAVCREVHLAARSSSSVAVVGEPGVGKQAVARALHAVSSPSAPLQMLDAAASMHDERGWLRIAGRGARVPGTVVVAHAELLSSGGILGLLTFFRDVPGRLIVTAEKQWLEQAPRPVTDALSWQVHIPPLRHRRSDISLLVNAFVRRHSPDPMQRRVAMATMSALVSDEWPGNARELERVVVLALARRPRGEITLDDLPHGYGVTSRRVVLGPLEELERDAIVRALEEARGNKQAAAAALGIARSTLYRKLHVYGQGRAGSDCRAGRTATRP